MVVTKQGAFKPRVITIPEWLFEDVCFQEEIRGVYYVDTPTLIYVHRSDHFFFTTQVASLDLSGANKLKRYSHEGYLIKVVAMALAGDEVARELSPTRSWSNKNYEI